MGRVRAAIVCLLALAAAGCSTIGAQRVGIDRDDYTERLRDSEKEQLLSNIVAMRYGDAPLFLSVASVISQYTRESSGGLNLKFSPPSDAETGGVSGAVLLRESPTVTYTPLSGERFTRSLLSPMPPGSLLAMMEAGWASDYLLRIAVRSINGVRNTSRAELFAQAGDLEFEAVAAAMRRLQGSGALNLRLHAQEHGVAGVAQVAPHPAPAQLADIELLKRLLGVKFDGEQVRVVFAARPTAPGELAISTRSMFEVLGEMAQGVDLTGGGEFSADALVRVHSGTSRPAQAHVAVQHRGRWFWIEADDVRSKQVFLLAQVMLSLSDEADAARAPLVTIPAG
ncbi:hypothetical protein [Phenylobacterium sp.]|uniref:hypothetical protein n=1 Tax=Phenylobacterium sp. TaxID=1871053 RepID=UPI002898DF8A|nr:hypothetical protein [Phenylobacterium sp.]